VPSDKDLSHQQKVSSSSVKKKALVDMNGEGCDGEDEIGDYSDHHFCDKKNAVKNMSVCLEARQDTHPLL
jgi:hypothetical protein